MWFSFSSFHLRFLRRFYWSEKKKIVGINGTKPNGMVQESSNRMTPKPLTCNVLCLGALGLQCRAEGVDLVGQELEFLVIQLNVAVLEAAVVEDEGGAAA